MRSSLLIFFYNHRRFVEDALSAIRNQRIFPDEILLTDDASTDGTQEVLSTFAQQIDLPCKVGINLNSKNLGLTRHVNQAIRATSGEIILLAGGDDLLVPQFTLRALDILKDDVTTGLLVNAAVVDENDVCRGRLAEMTGDEVVTWSSLFSDFRLRYHCGFKRHVFEEFGPLEIGGEEDVQLTFREALSGRVFWSNEPIVRYRRHGANMTDWTSVVIDEEVDQWRFGRAKTLERRIQSQKGMLRTLEIARAQRYISREDLDKIEEILNRGQAQLKFALKLSEYAAVSNSDCVEYLRQCLDFHSIAKATVYRLAPRLALKIMRRNTFSFAQKTSGHVQM